MIPPFASVVEGSIRVLEVETDDQFEHLDESDSDGQSTLAPDEARDDDISSIGSSHHFPVGEIGEPSHSWERNENQSQSDSDEHDVDGTFLVSGSPQVLQLDNDNPYPWLNDDLPDPDEQIMGQEDAQASIQFAAHHQGYLQDEIEQIMNLGEEDDTPWIAVTFGLGLVDLGQREVQFQPHDLEELAANVLQTWADHAAYGDLILYHVHPQPYDYTGPRTIALLVVVDLPESMDESIRHVLVFEQSAGEVQTRARPYGARLTSEASDKEIMAQLSLHAHCIPFALRMCKVRLGTTFMERKQFYEFEHGTLCRTWIGNTFPQLAEAEQSISDVEKFFLQVTALTEAVDSDEFPKVVCRLHGISPENSPLGFREVIIPVDFLYDLDWIQEFQVIWPFGDENINIHFVSAMTADQHENGKPIFHFIVKCGFRHGTPILVRQHLVPVDHTIRETQGADELWAISVPSGAASVAVVQALSGRPFWYGFCREQHVYPHMSLDGTRLLDVQRDWRPGDLLSIRYLVWEQSHVLTLMLGAAQENFPTEPEFTSFLQRHVNGKRFTNSHVRDQSVTDSTISLSTLRSSWRDNSDPPELQDKMTSDVDAGSHFDGHLNSNCASPLLREGLRANSDPLDSQGCQQFESSAQGPTLHDWQMHAAKIFEAFEDVSWCEHTSDSGFGISKNEPHCKESDDSDLHQLQGCVQQLLEPRDVGLNLDWTHVPGMHPFAVAACQVTEQDSGQKISAANRFHIFTDGSCKGSSATWAFTVLCEQTLPSHKNFIRVGYAAGQVNEVLGPVEQTAQDAEATAIAAAAEFLLSKELPPNMDVFLQYDAQSVGHGSTGQHATVQQNPMVSNRQKIARVLVHMAQRKHIGISGLHVHAHHGNPWNEMVDSLARAVRCGWAPEKSFQWQSTQLFQHPLHCWAWMMVRPDKELPTLSTILRNDAPKDFMGHYDSTLYPRDQGVPNDLPKCTLRVATANVSTLEQDTMLADAEVSFKTNEILHQLLAKNIHVTAIQESRARKSKTIQHGPFTCFVSAALGGVGGVELWINGEALSRIFRCSFTAADVCVWYANHRLMAARFHLQNLTFEIIIGYAPQKGRDASEIQQWWREVDEVFAQTDSQATRFLLEISAVRLAALIQMRLELSVPTLKIWVAKPCVRFANVTN
eukprot:s2553_g7.t1